MSYHSRTSRVLYKCFFAAFLGAFFLSSSTLALAGAGEGYLIKNPPRLELDTELLSITLVWYDAYELLPYTFEAMAGETRQIFAELGVDVRWEKGQIGDADWDAAQDPLRLNVILHPHEATAWGLKEGVMGMATHRDGMKGSAYIFFPQVVQSLGLDAHVDSLENPRAYHLLAQAIGRVAAHEIVHVLAPNHPHAGKGLMKGRMTRSILQKRNVSLDPASSQVVLAELRARQQQITVALVETTGEPGKKFEGIVDRLGVRYE